MFAKVGIGRTRCSLQSLLYALIDLIRALGSRAEGAVLPLTYHVLLKFKTMDDCEIAPRVFHSLSGGIGSERNFFVGIGKRIL